MLTDKNRNKSGRGYTIFLEITVKVLAETAGLHKETVRRHIREGTLNPWSLRDIRRWLDEYGVELDEAEDEIGGDCG
jgi:hypothetical protein